MYPPWHWLKEAREARNLSQTKLARRIGKDPRSVSDWERGISRPDIDAAWPLAHELGGTPEEMAARIATHFRRENRLPPEPAREPRRPGRPARPRPAAQLVLSEPTAEAAAG